MGRQHLARHVRPLRDRPLLDRPDRLARDAIEDVDEALLAHLGYRPDGSAADRDVHQVGVRREVVVPQAVVHGLEVPHALPRLDVNGDQRLREEVVPQPVDAVVVVGGRSGRQIHVAELVVAGQHRPDVGVPRVAPRLVQPGVDAELVRAVRHGLKVPGVLAGPHVPGAHPARDRFLRDAAVCHLRPVDYAVTDDDRRRVDPEQQGVQVVALLAVRPRQPDHRVHHAAAVGAEVRARPAALGVGADEVAIARAPEDPLVPGPIGPVGDAPLRPGIAHRRRPLLVGLRIEDPQRLAGSSVDRDALRERRVDVENAVHHQRRRLQARQERPVAGPVEVGGLLDQRVDDGVERGRPLAAARRREADAPVHGHPFPGDLQVREVPGVDLIERRVLLSPDAPGVAPPLAAGGVVGLPRAGLAGRLGVHGNGPAEDESEHHGWRWGLEHGLTSVWVAAPG